MGLIQTAFEFGPRRPAPWLDPEAERTRKERLLEQQLGRLLGGSVALTVTDNARTMLSARHREGIAHVRLHHMFVDADEATVSAVARYLTDGHDAASSHLQRFIKQNRDRIRARAREQMRADRSRATGADAPGRHHDLHALLAQLNARYFEPAVHARIAWARMARGLGHRRRRRSIKLGSYRGREPLIRVHPVLDAAWVPSFFVEYIVYHEMLHHVVAMPVQNGRRSLHGPEFRALERQFGRYTEAIAWERANLDRLLSG
jgi:predicted metal-dependent hydrolase